VRETGAFAYQEVAERLSDRFSAADSDYQRIHSQVEIKQKACELAQISPNITRRLLRGIPSAFGDKQGDHRASG
jgi:hypothetical protein